MNSYTDILQQFCLNIRQCCIPFLFFTPILQEDFQHLLMIQGHGY